MLIYSFITDYQAFNLRYKDNTTRDKNETKVDKQSANLGKNNEPIQNRLSFLIDCKSVILHHLAILSFPMVRPAWDNWWLLVDWFKSDVSRDELRNYIQRKWEIASNSSIPTDLKERMFRKIQSRIESVAVEKKEVGRFSLRNIMRYAAIGLLVICAGLGGHLLTRYSRSVGAEKDYLVFAAKGQKASVVLPDGSKVWLNSDSEIKYTNLYGDGERIISLDGEAYFEVAKDSLNRFVVQAGDLAVEALGTSFNVKAYEEDNQAVVTLFQGKVKTSVGRDEAFLLPDQAVTYLKNKGQLKKSTLNDAYRACLWRNNELAFNDEALSEIAVLLNRMYNIQVVFKSEKVKALRFTGVITNNSLDNIIELISLTSPIIYTSKGDTIIIDEKK